MLLLEPLLMILSTMFLIIDTTHQDEKTADLTRVINQGTRNMILTVTTGNGNSFCDNNNVTL